MGSFMGQEAAFDTCLFFQVRREISLVDDNTLAQKVFMATEKVNDMRLHADMIYKRSPKLLSSSGL